MTVVLMQGKIPLDSELPQLERPLLRIFIYSGIVIHFIVYTSRGHDKLTPLISRARNTYAQSCGLLAPGCSISRRTHFPGTRGCLSRLGLREDGAVSFAHIYFPQNTLYLYSLLRFIGGTG
jgi:hypothetical protein